MADDDQADFPEAQCLRETSRALLVRFDGHERWVPKSVIDDDSEVYQEGDQGKLVVKAWFAEKEGWL